MNKVLIICLLVITNTYAFDVQEFRPLPSKLGLLTQFSAENNFEKEWDFKYFYNFVNNPIEFGNKNKEKIDSIVEKLHSFDLSASYGFSDSLTFLFDFRADYASVYEGVGTDKQTKEVAALGDIRLGAHYSINDAWAAAALLTLPTGDSDILLGASSLVGELKLIRDFNNEKDKHYFTTSAGFIFRKSTKLFNLIVNDGLRWGLGYAYRFTKEEKWRVFTEVFGEHPLTSTEDKLVAAPAEALIGFKKEWNNKRSEISFGYGHGLNTGFGAPDHRVFVGINMSFDKNKKVSQPILEPVIAKEIVKEPVVSELPRIHTGKIYFASGKDKILETSYNSLKKVFDALKKFPEIEEIIIAGHTDSSGVSESNQILSDRRAKSVANYFIGLGISSERLIPRGFGEDKPIDTNETAEGKSNNRRVEFSILKTKKGFKFIND